MTQHDNRALGLVEDQSDRAAEPSLADLEHLYTTAPPAHLRDAMDRAMQARMTALGGASPRTRSSFLPAWGRRSALVRLASLVTALLLALSGAVGYLRFSTPMPVNAQTVLRRAAAALQLAPNQAAHLIDNVSMTYDGRTANGTADVWLQTDAGGATALSAQTLTMGKPGVDSATVPATSSRFIQVGQQILAYNPEMGHNNTILIASLMQTRAYPSWVMPNDVFDGAGVAQSLSRLAQQSPERVRLLPQQTLDGVTVNVIEVDGWIDKPAQRTTFYFDAQSSILRGFDAASMDPTYPTPAWQARLRSYETMAATVVPPHTFTLDAPATASIAPFDLGGPAFSTFAAAVTATCHSSVNVKLLAFRSGQSLLTACQVTAPGMTAADLVAALSAPDKAALDAAVAAGVLTPAQAVNYLTKLQTWFTTWITTPVSPGQSK